MSDQADPVEGIDFALVAYREEGAWQVQDMSRHLLVDVPTIGSALRRLPADHGAMAMVAMDEDYFLVVRVLGTTTRVLLSDVTAADEWELAASALDFLGLPPPVDDDEQVPAGDVAILEDLGMSSMDLAALLDDYDLYPDEMLSDVARRLGFGQQFDDAVGLTSA